MRIRELTLVNYRAFARPAPFIFAERFTLIAGINGRGKTAMLNAIALLASRFLPLVSESHVSSVRIRPSEVHRDATAAELAMKVNCAGIPLDYRLTYRKRDRKITATELPYAVREEVRNRYGDPIRSDDAAPLVVYYTTERSQYSLPRRLPKDVPQGQAAAYLGALSGGPVNFRDFMARYRNAVVLGDQERLEDPNYIGDRAATAIAAALNTFLGGFGNLRVQEAPLRLLVDKEDWSLDLSQLSDGERSFLAMVCDLGRRLALANPMVQNPLSGYGIVLVDELELHLHPTWQLEIVEKLRNTFPNIQFITTTHSPFIVQTAREGELIKLDGELALEPAGRTLEEVARLVMDVTNTERSPRFNEMLDTARKYFALVEEEKAADPGRRDQIQNELITMLAPFTDNPAYIALLERKGLVREG